MVLENYIELCCISLVLYIEKPATKIFLVSISFNSAKAIVPTVGVTSYLVFQVFIFLSPI